MLYVICETNENVMHVANSLLACKIGKYRCPKEENPGILNKDCFEEV